MLLDFQSLVMDLVRDEANKITPDARDQAIARAVTRYSADRPRELVEDVTASNSNTLPLPASWETDFSEVRALEYPIGDVPASYIDPAQYYLYQAPSVAKTIRVTSGLAAAAAVRVTFTARHSLTPSIDTLPERDREAVTCWAAALLCDQLAALYANDSAPTIQADSVDHQNQAREYGTRANKLRARYFDELGLDPKRAVPAGVVVNLDNNNSLGGDRLTHPRRYR